MLSQQLAFLPKKKGIVSYIVTTHLAFGGNGTVSTAKAEPLFRILFGIIFSVMYDWIRIGTHRIFGNSENFIQIKGKELSYKCLPMLLCGTDWHNG